MNESFKHIRIVNILKIELKNNFLGSYKIQLHPFQFFCSALPQRSNQVLGVQNLFEKLKKLIIKLFDPNIEIAYIFTSKLLRSEEMQDNFGITVREQDNLEDQNVSFIDGLYYIIPNSKTLTIRRESGEMETLLTRNNLTHLTEEEIINRLNNFFLDVVNYVREEFDIEMS